MSLRLICGRAGTGKSNFCFEEIKQRIKSNEQIYIITPEQYSYTAEKKLLEKLESGSSINAEVLTFNRMSYRVLNEVGGVVRQNLSKMGKAMLIYDILDKQKSNLKFLGKNNQNIKLIETELTELKKHSVSLKNLKEVIEKEENRYLQEKLKDIYIIYENYEKSIENKYIEENDRLEILENQLEKTNLFKDAIFYIDEFTGFTKQEYKIIEKLLIIAKEVNITIVADNLDLKQGLEKDVFYTNKVTADKLLYIARSNNIVCKETIFLNKFYRFKNEELQHLEQNIQNIPYKVYEKEVNNLSIFLAQNPYTEIEEVSKRIIKLIKEENYRYKDIVVMTKQMDTYSSLCKAIFNSYNIPVFMDEKKELSQNNFVKYILAILEIYSSNWSYESVIQYLKTGFIDMQNEEIYEFENYTKKWGIRGSKWYKSSFDFGKEQSEEEKQKDIRMQKTRDKVIRPLIELKENLSGKKNVNQINVELYKFLIKNKIEEKIKTKRQQLENENKLEIAQQEELAWNLVIGLLEEMNNIFENENITFEKYKELLKIALGQEGLGNIPETQDQIILGSLERTRTHKVKVIFLIGVNDGIFPTIQKQEGFLNDADRQNLRQKGIELAKGTLENLYEDNLNIYKAITTAEEKIFFSYCSSDPEGTALRPSTYITKIKKIFPKIKIISDLIENDKFEIINESNTFEELINVLRKSNEGNTEISEFWQNVEYYFSKKDEWKYKLQNAKMAIGYENKPEKISKENIEKLYGSVVQTSISKLEQYRSCPFSYYLKYGLKLKEAEEYKMKPIDTGTFMHEIIDSFFTIVRERNLEIKNLEAIEVELIVESIINEKLQISKYYIFTSSDKFKTLTNSLKRVVIKSIKYIVEGLKNSDFEVYANELEFKRGSSYKPITLDLYDGKKVEITGKIDRIDITKTSRGNYIRIIDYKSSVKNIDLNEVIAGLQIQLLTYLDETCKIEDVMPAGMLYYNLIDPILKVDKKPSKEQLEDMIRKNFKMSGYILSDVNIIKMMDKKLEDGYSNVIPVYLGKDGNVSKSKSNILTEEQFENLRKYTNKIIKEISNEMLSGNIDILPYYEKKNKKTPCDYCSYKSICNFKEGKCNYRYIENNKQEDVLDKIKEE